MVVTLGPGRFYGSGLPRPWFHPDVKFAEERVDPPPPVLDPLLRWAREAHWSMGGLSFQRHRLQGRIEGSIKKIRAEAERAVRSSSRSEKKKMKKIRQQNRREGEERSRKRRLLSESGDGDDEKDEEEGRDEEVKEDEEACVEVATSSPRRLSQRQRRRTILDEDTSDSDHDEKAAKQGVSSAPLSPDRPRRKSVRRLGVEFDRVAASGSPQAGKRQRI